MPMSRHTDYLLNLPYALKKMYILQLLGAIVYILQLSQICLMWYLNLLYVYCFVLFFSACSITHWKKDDKIPTELQDLYISPFITIICFLLF